MRPLFRDCALCCLLTAGVACAQKPIVLTEPEKPLLPDSFGAWKAATVSDAPTSPLALGNANKAALAECGPQRSKVTDYQSNDGGNLKTLVIEAIEFGDRTGAFSAFTLLARPGMKQSKGIGDLEAAGDGALLIEAGSSVLLVYPATSADAASLRPLVEGLPKPAGNKAVPPLLPSFLPAKALVDGSVRYALGPETYAAEGGVLPAQSLGWDKSAEAITALYTGKHGRETLTLLLYPTPTIAGAYQHAAEAQVKAAAASGSASFASAQVRREAELVMVASGEWPEADVQKFLADIHMKQQLSFDKDVQPVFHVEVQKTASLLTQILIFCAVFGTAAIVLGIFLGFGRAAVRVMMGKSAAAEPEFLSLHLDPQNKPPDLP